MKRLKRKAGIAFTDKAQAIRYKKKVKLEKIASYLAMTYFCKKNYTCELPFSRKYIEILWRENFV